MRSHFLSGFESLRSNVHVPLRMNCKNVLLYSTINVFANISLFTIYYTIFYTPYFVFPLQELSPGVRNLFPHGVPALTVMGFAIVLNVTDWSSMYFPWNCHTYFLIFWGKGPAVVTQTLSATSIYPYVPVSRSVIKLAQLEICDAVSRITVPGLLKLLRRIMQKSGFGTVQVTHDFCPSIAPLFVCYLDLIPPNLYNGDGKFA